MRPDPERGAALAIFTDKTTIRSSSELEALSNFRMAAFERGHRLDFLFKNELRFLERYDGILIRALTDPLNASYVVARRAELLGLRVLDSSESIRICCDKVNMYARLQAAGVPIPATRIVDEIELERRGTVLAAELFDELGTPLVLKAPNSSFSAYVEKVATPEAFGAVAKRFLRRAERLVVQRYTPSDFDWRVVTLAGRVLAVVQYRFVPDRWKLMDRGEGGEWARVEGVERSAADPELLRIALAAAAAVGDALHGVDLKEIDGEYTVIEVNDNPTIAAGEEDQANPEIYREIVDWLAGEETPPEVPGSEPTSTR